MDGGLKFVCWAQIGHEFKEKFLQSMFKKIAVALVAFVSVSAFAEGATCTASATEKKLAGAAKNSFMKKCESDAAAKCEAAATEKKLAGAAKTGNVKKCTREAVGAAA